MPKYILVAALAAASVSAHAEVTLYAPGYSLAPFLTHLSSDRVVSFDWNGAGAVDYQTATPAFRFGGLFQFQAGNISTLVPGSSDFAGASVVSLGDYVFYNTTPINRYGPLTGAGAATVVSTAPNYGLLAHGGGLFVTAATGIGGENHILFSAVNSGGALVDSPLRDLGATTGGSGPLAFDLAGNLYFAPGFGDLSIYRYEASEVADALAHPGTLTTAGHRLLDYSASYGAYSGATSMVLDVNGNLLVTLTNFSDSSLLVKFGITGQVFSGAQTTILEDSALAGEVRLHGGEVYLASENHILRVVPEPGTAALVGLGLLGFARRRRRSA